MAEYLIVTGLSGAGRSSAGATLEDLGWFVIDNLPPALIGKVVELASHPGSELDRFCFVAGRGGAETLSELGPELSRLRAGGARVRLLFLDASDEVLVRRFEGTRRRHPVEADTVLAAIAAERALLAELRDAADVVIDTSEMNVNDLRARLVELFASSEAAGMMETAVVSFGFKHGIPLDVDLVLDCRFLPNPHWVDELRPLTGLETPVRDYVLGQEEAKAFLAKLDDLLAFLLPAYAKEGKSYLSIAIGCTGGRHRSVVIAEEIAARIAEHGFRPTVHHRDIAR
ncbi:MAG TPA: RNase adapter RapZ [Acidimicrobiales bacterium]|nr:RNase adapter RapZ [Acidimicrobiales bacterium]